MCLVEGDNGLLYLAMIPADRRHQAHGRNLSRGPASVGSFFNMRRLDALGRQAVDSAWQMVRMIWSTTRIARDPSVFTNAFWVFLLFTT